MSNDTGDVVRGKVVRIRAYGAFVQLEDGETGLVHISEIAEEFVRSVSDYLNEGEDVTVKVLGRNEEEKLNLSIKQVQTEDVEAMRYEQRMAEVQRDLSEREQRLTQAQVDIPQVHEQPDRPFMDWAKEARGVLKRVERNQYRRKQGQGSDRPRRSKPSR